MKSFKLVNPLILGKFNTEYKAETGLEAISQFWNDLGTHITNNMPSLYVSLKDENDALTHYKISEKIEGGSQTTNFAITEHENKMSEKETKKFLKHIKQYEKKMDKKIQRQNGGVKSDRSRHKSSSSSSSDDSDSDDDYYNFSKYKRFSQPITLWHYTPTIYSIKSVFVPTFTAPIVPYVKLWMPTLF